MTRSIIFFLTILVLSLSSCTQKKAGPQRDFELAMSPSDAMERIVDEINQKNFPIQDVRADTGLITTLPEMISPERLKEITFLSDDIHRFEHGRFALEISVSPTSKGSRVHIEATIEGEYVGKQRGSAKSGAPQWRAEQSNGTLEQEIIDGLSST